MKTQVINVGEKIFNAETVDGLPKSEPRVKTWPNGEIHIYSNLKVDLDRLKEQNLDFENVDFSIGYHNFGIGFSDDLRYPAGVYFFGLGSMICAGKHPNSGRLVIDMVYDETIVVHDGRQWMVKRAANDNIALIEVVI